MKMAGSAEADWGWTEIKKLTGSGLWIKGEGDMEVVTAGGR
jgi:hypothetical protein